MLQLVLNLSTDDAVTPEAADTTHMVNVRLLGAVRVEKLRENGDPEIRLRGGKAMALLAYLLLSSARVHRRAVVADLLWGDESPEHARGSLRQALAALRRALGAEVIRADKENVSLELGATRVDALEFLAASKRGELSEMLAAYRGPLCAGIDVRGAHAFVQWLDGEQERFRRLLLSRALEVLPLGLASGRREETLRMARAVYAVMPDETAAACVLFDALVANDEAREALEIIEGARATEARAGMGSSPEVARRLARAQAAQAPLAPNPSVRRGWNARLVGREQQLAALSDAVESVRTDGPLYVAVIGVAGMGKTRLLDECESRWRLRGHRTVRVRFVKGMRDVPLAGLSELVRGFAALPGAIGVSPKTAATLLGVVPELQAQYPGVQPRNGATLGELTLAWEDLSTAVAERRAVIAILDDLHLADDGTRHVLSAARVARGIPLLQICGSRPGGAPEVDRMITVSALEEADVRALLHGAARLPATSWAAALPRVIVESTGGVPQLVDQVIRQLVEQQLLVIDDGAWHSDESDALLKSAAQLRHLEDSISSRSPRARAILRVLARWRLELREDALLAVLRRLEPSYTEHEWRESLGALEEAALLLARDATWQISHESVAEAVLRLEPTGESEGAMRAIIASWRDVPLSSVREVEHVARLCGELDYLAGAEDVAAMAAMRREWRVPGRGGEELAKHLARAAGRDDWTRALYRSMKFLARQSRRSLLRIGAAAAAAVLISLWSAWMLQPRLIVEVGPMGERLDLAAAVLVVQPRLVVRDGFGRSLAWVTGEVRARTVNSPVAGDSIVRLQNGRAQFKTLALASVADTTRLRDDVIRLDFRGPWYVRSVRQTVSGAWLGAVPDAFRVTEARVNDEPLGADMVARVRPGAPLLVDVVFEYSTARATANYVVGAWATWTPRDSVIRLTGLPRPIRGGWQSVSVRLPAPDGPGPHYLVVLSEAEDRVENTFSATNWTLGVPVWNDGNDVADLPMDALERLRQNGTVKLAYQSQDYQGPQGDLRVGDSLFFRRRKLKWVEPRIVSGSAIRIDVLN